MMKLHKALLLALASAMAGAVLALFIAGTKIITVVKKAS